MLSTTKLPHQFWAEALATAVYLRNRSPTKAVEGMTPLEALTGEKPNVEHLKTFSCTAYAHVPRMSARSLTPKSRKCIFLGYGTDTKCIDCMILIVLEFYTAEMFYLISRPMVLRTQFTKEKYNLLLLALLVREMQSLMR